MKPFLTEDFLLDTAEAQALYAVAKACPILDYHSHISAKDLAANRHYANITEAWLEGDHYKWRAMRTTGVPESLITGDADPRQKFEAWARTVPRLLKNPLYHWTHLELAHVFGIKELLSPATTETIWAQSKAYLETHGARDILKQMHVEVLCTTDDPGEDLAAHQQVNREEPSFRIFPTWRPERAMKLTERYGTTTLRELLAFLEKRHAAFDAVGCRLSDYSVESWATPLSMEEAEKVFNQTNPSPEARAGFAAFMLELLAHWDHASNWVRQMHIGALRNPNTAMFDLLGPDTGFDAIDDSCYARSLANHLSTLAKEQALPRTILYNLNPRDNAMIAVLCGSFQDGTPGGRVNYGPAWWFLDQSVGMREQLETLAQLGCLQQFPGMVTDSRSVLSMPRHEYFRRVLCNMLGEDWAKGRLPDDRETLVSMVKAMCYENAKTTFGFCQ